MTTTGWLVLAGAVVLVVYVAFIAALLLTGRKDAARALAGFIPDCVVLCRRLAGDHRVPRRHKLLLGAVVLYLALPFDLVPDFLPVVGQLDDALVVALAVRAVLRGTGPELVREHWPGPASSLAVVLRLVGGPEQEGAECL